MLWANVLHIYQPPTQDPDIIHRVVKESYGPLVDGLAKTPTARITLNICGVLTEWLEELGYIRVIGEIGEAAKRGQVEFLASAKYHPILPLIPHEEAKRQIFLNTETNRKYFGPVYNPRGFFMPEMAYSREVGELVAGMGYKYLVMDEIGFNKEAGGKKQEAGNKFEKPLSNKLYSLDGYPNFTIFFRNRRASDILSFGKKKTAEGLLQGMLAKALAGDQYLITAVDGETFGHHRKKFDQLLFAAYQILSHYNVQPILLGDLLDDGKIGRIRGKRWIGASEVDPMASSWSSQLQELARGIPYALWDNPGNSVHEWQWRLAMLALREVKRESFDFAQDKKLKVKSEKEKLKYDETRDLLDRALHSDQFWWASGFRMKAIKKVFWNRKMIDRGATLLANTITSIPGVDSETLALARDYYLAIGESAAAFEKVVKASGAS